MGLVEVKRSDKGRFAFERTVDETLGRGSGQDTPAEDHYLRTGSLWRVATTRNSLDSTLGTSRR
jgi:hypothetical protein